MFGEPLGLERTLELCYSSLVRRERKFKTLDEMDRIVSKKVEKHIKLRGGLGEIQKAAEIMDKAYLSVEEAFESSKDMSYFERRNYMIPILKEFYQKIKELYPQKEAYIEYNSYFEHIMEEAGRGTRYPYLDEIEHETIETEPEKTLDLIVQQTRKEVCSRKNGNYEWFFYFKCMDAQKYVNELLKDNTKIQNVPIDTQKDCKFPYYQHAINLVKINGKKYIIDPTYIQFCDLRSTPDIVGIAGCIGAVPGQYLMDSDEKKEFLHGLVKYGFFEVTEENLKMYFDSFVLANRSGEYYSNHPKASKMQTEFSGSDYAQMLAGKKELDICDRKKSKTRIK